MRPGLLPRASALALLLALAAGLATADFRESYRLGTEALDAGNWAEAIRQLEEAIAERPEENIGMFRRYLPHFHLGVAYFESGDCARALAAWAESERQGVVNGVKEYETLQQGRQTCRSRQQDERLRRAMQQLDGGIGEAAEARARVVSLSGRAEIQAAVAADPTVAERLQQADRQLDDARRVMRTARRIDDLGDLGRAHNLTIEARQAYAALADELGQRLEAARGRLDAGQRALDDRVAEARDLLASIQPLRPLPAGLARLAAEVGGQLDAIRAVEPATPPAELARLEKALVEALARLRPAAQPPPRLLRSAAEEFVAGAYEAVLETLAEFRLADARAAAHAYLLRAASHWALALAAGAEGERLLAAAREDALSCMASDASVRPRESVFSPRFVAFFEAQRPATAEGGP